MKVLLIIKRLSYHLVMTPAPGSIDSSQTNTIEESENPLVNSILEQTEANSANNSIIDKIDEDSGYKSDEGFFKWL